MHSFLHRLAHEAVKLVGEEGMKKMSKNFENETLIQPDDVIRWVKEGRKVCVCAWNYNHDDLLGMLKGGDPPHYGEFRIKQDQRWGEVYTVAYREDVNVNGMKQLVKWLSENTPGAREAQGRYLFENGKYVHPDKNPRSEASPSWYGGSFAK